MEPLIWEKGDKLYIVAPVSPFSPGATEIEEFAFAEQLKSMAPNENLMWLRGQYVEADNPNRNGQTWSAGELAIKSLTPMLMPVTVMHDPRTAVGTIADTKLLVPDKDEVPRARIDTSLAVWKHRFPEVAEEAQHNYEAGSLMQSMECMSPHYSCRECGQVFQKLPEGKERENWCAHLKEAAGLGARILGNVVFTGTGLIFGSRGAKGAFDQAHLDVFQDEVAEALDRSHADRPKQKPRRTNRMETIEIPRTEYDALKSRPTRDEFDAEKARADKAEEEKTEAERERDAAEVAKKDAEEAKTAAEQKVTEAEEASNAIKLSEERMGKLGSKFRGKLPDSIKDRLPEQAKSLSEEEWDARLTELSDLVGVKPDENEEGEEEEGDKGGDKGGAEFSREEVARSQAGGDGGGKGEGKEPSATERASVMRGLMPKAAAEKAE